MSEMAMDFGPFCRLSRLFYLITIICGLVFNSTLHHSHSIRPELLTPQTEEVNFYPDPFEWDNKFQAIPRTLTAHFIQSQFLLEMTYELSFNTSQVYPFSSFAIPPPLRIA